MFLAFLFLFSCRNADPVVPGIDEDPLLTEINSAKENRESRKIQQQQKAQSSYQKSPEVYIDINYLGGKMHKAVQDAIQDQLGNLQKKQALSPKDGERRFYEFGEIRTLDDQIYMIKITLPEAMRRSEALLKTGFPEQVDKYKEYHKEYQLHNEWGFRRIRMRRESPESELITQFEAWKWVPNERVRK
jgi:hypothetical protein